MDKRRAKRVKVRQLSTNTKYVVVLVCVRCQAGQCIDSDNIVAPTMHISSLVPIFFSVLVFPAVQELADTQAV